MARKKRPRKGSLGFSPRKRAAREAPRFGSFPEDDDVGIQGFAGYKAGMTHVIMVDDRPNSPTEGLEVQRAATVVETPPVRVNSVRTHEKRHDGLATITEASDDEGLAEAESFLPRTERVSVTVSTDPSVLTGVPAKEPVSMEFPVSGDAADALEYASGLLDDTVRFDDVFTSGELVDVAAVTKGKGTEGPVKRWGVKIQGRKAKRKGRGRHIGNLGPWHPTRVRWQVPQTGQEGYHHRTEMNKRILKIGDTPDEVNPDGGFKRYGLVRGDHALLKGSVPGPVKRLVGIRKPLRPKELPEEPTVNMVSTRSRQGV
ncbi:MAG: 50S ribosomal protein L3 [Methanonatronarchaeales archaeon]|nr:50S ribosomal protein L3 [Methanonatronarchaeales archaeon]